MGDFACVLLVDRRGWLLLQERDDRTPVDPDRWGYPGGGIEPGETAEQAAYRELAEETGIVLDGGLELVRSGVFWCVGHQAEEEFTLYAAPTDRTDADVVCTEGRQIVFVDPEVAHGLDLTASAAASLADLLASATYARLREAAGRLGEGASGRA